MAHHSPHGHRAAVDFGAEVEHLREGADAKAESYRRLAERLSEPGDRVCVDIGCGAAGMALALAAARPAARVVAVDAEDQAAWEALLDADGPHWLGARRDLHHLEFQSIYVGVKH